MFKKLFASQTNLSTDALEIILTGPFQTGNPLDFSRTTTNDYRKIQEAVRDKMGEVFPLYMWEIPKSGEGQKYKMGEGGTGKAYSPSYYLECIMDCKKIKCNFKKYNFTIKKMQIKFYEFGFATVSIFGMISLKDSSRRNAKIISSDLLRIVNDLDEKIVNGEVQQIRTPISNITKKFIKTISENNIKDFFANEKTLNEETNIITNNIRSLHRIFKYKVNKNSKIKVAQRALNKIAKLSNGQWKKENYFSHFVGIANSAIVYNCNISSNCKNIDEKILNQYKKAYETVPEMANAYYFIAEYIKSGLSDYSRESIALKKSKNIFKILKNYKQSEEVEEGLNKFILLSSNFFSVFDEFIINLSPQGKNIWDKMTKTWNTSETAQMLQSQLQNSLQITERVLTQTAKKMQKWAIFIATGSLTFAGLTLSSAMPTSDFNLEFEIDIWNYENATNTISKIINTLSSLLVVIFVVIAIIALIRVVCFIVKSLCKLLRKLFVWLIKIICKKIQTETK